MCGYSCAGAMTSHGRGLIVKHCDCQSRSDNLLNSGNNEEAIDDHKVAQRLVI